MAKKYNIKGNQEEKKIQNKLLQEQIFNELLKKCRKNSHIIKNQLNKNWQKLKENKISYSIRCQAVRNNKPGEQCINTAMHGTLLCKNHSMGIEKKKEITKIKQSLGIYSGSGVIALQKELAEVQHLTDADLQDTTDELKLGISLLRKYLKETDDEKIAKNPGQLMWLIGEISRLKKEYYEIKHSKNVSFTKEQVVFLFNQVYLILIKLVKDVDLLKSIGEEIDEVGKRIGKEGFKNVN